MKFNLIQGLRQVFRAVHIFASSLATQGTYLTSATVGSDTIILVENTSQFPASGSGQIIDTLNDRNTFTYTGKTATSLTGCSGVLAHVSGMTVIPLKQDVVIDSNINSIRFFADRGDGVIEELASIGVKSLNGDVAVIAAGEKNNISGGGNKTAVIGYAPGTEGRLAAPISGSGYGVLGNAKTQGYGVACQAGLESSGALAPLLVIPADNVIPTHSADAGSVYPVGINPNVTSFYVQCGPGTTNNWKLLGPIPAYISTPQAITSAGALTLAHGLGTIPTLVQVWLKCITADAGYSAGDIVPVGTFEGARGDNNGVMVLPDATNLNIRFGSNTNTSFWVTHKTTGGSTGIVNANWNAIFRAWVI